MNEPKRLGRINLLEWLNDNKPVDTIILFSMSCLAVLTFSWAIQHFFGWVVFVVVAALVIGGLAVGLALFVFVWLVMWLVGDFNH